MPVDRGAIDAQLKDIGEGERWWEHREFRDLPYVLNPDEKIQGLTSGKLVVSRLRPRVLPHSPWLLVATNQRLLCLKQERFGRKQVELRVGQITGILHASRLRSYQITLETPQRRYRIRIPKADAFRFIGALAPLMPPPAAQLPAGAPPQLPHQAGIPGLLGLVSRTSLPAPEYATAADLARVDGAVERLENEVERLRQQVEFMEKLLQDRGESVAFLPRSPADS